LLQFFPGVFVPSLSWQITALSYQNQIAAWKYYSKNGRRFRAPVGRANVDVLPVRNTSLCGWIECDHVWRTERMRALPRDRASQKLIWSVLDVLVEVRGREVAHFIQPLQLSVINTPHTLEEADIGSVAWRQDAAVLLLHIVAAAAQYAAFVLVEFATFQTIALSFVVAAARIQLVACKNTPCFSTLPIFVPSLSWQVDRLFWYRLEKAGFRTG
jgi:hypothetical protein